MFNAERKFKIKKFDLKKLLDMGFVYSQPFSTEDANAYIKNFIVYRYFDIGILDARIIIYTDCTVKIDIIDRISRGFYAPWYVESPDRWEILTSIESNLQRTIKKLGVKEIGSKNKKTNKDS